jgi:hypothetical protein
VDGLVTDVPTNWLFIAFEGVFGAYDFLDIDMERSLLSLGTTSQFILTSLFGTARG